MSLRMLLYIVAATAVAGVLDLLLACLNVYLTRGAAPEVVFRFIASGIYGTKAFDAGTSFKATGIFLHFFITLLFVLFYLVFYRNNAVKKHWMIAGIIYGIAICLLMNFIVLPLSNTPKSPVAFYPVFKLVVIQIIATGIPIAWLFKYFVRTTS
jgi:thiosulfate reductase cytochrome b subunit